jgi:hypothetical protein
MVFMFSIPRRNGTIKGSRYKVLQITPPSPNIVIERVRMTLRRNLEAAPFFK